MEGLVIVVEMANLLVQIEMVRFTKLVVKILQCHQTTAIPNCRCTTIAYIDEDTKKNLQRRAKTKDGKAIVMSYTNYNDWKKDNL